MTVAPVVVSPERDSKRASTYFQSGLSVDKGSEKWKGRAPKRPRIDQNITTMTKPSLVRNSLLCFEYGSHSKNPALKVMTKDIPKAHPAPSPLVLRAMISDGSMDALKAISSIPIIFKVTRKCILRPKRIQ
jgi:hypothetical protein